MPDDVDAITEITSSTENQQKTSEQKYQIQVQLRIIFHQSSGHGFKHSKVQKIKSFLETVWGFRI